MRLIQYLLGLIIFGLTHVAASATDAPPAPVLPDFPSLPAATPLMEFTSGEITFETRTPYDFDTMLNAYASLPGHSGMGRLFLPAGANARAPVPAVVLVHGSGGISAGREFEYASLLVAHGYAALVIDYYTPRGITTNTPYLQKTLGVTEFDAVADAYAALRALNRHPSIDPRRIALAGFSYGGTAARIALDARVRAVLAPEFPPFASHMDYYGPCFQDFNVKNTTDAPLLTLRGGDDASNDLVACAAREAQLRQAGSAVSSVIYAKAGHAWENLAPRTVNTYPYVSGCTLSYDEAGYPSVNGKPVIPVAADRSRGERARMRMASGSLLASCVQVGYVVGRDDATRAQSDYQLVQFLRQTLR